jgi:hypothetical protein
MAGKPNSAFKTAFTAAWSEALHAAFNNAEGPAKADNNQPDAELVRDVVRFELLARRADVARGKFRTLLRCQKLDPEVEKQLIHLADIRVTSIFEAWRGAFTRFVRPNVDLLAVCEHLTQRQRKCSQTKQDRVRRRHEEMDKAIAQGIAEENQLFRFMQENHPELIRKGRGYISPEQMMRAYRDAKKRSRK